MAGQQQLRRLRIKEVEVQYLMGRRPEQIHEVLVEKYGQVTLGTVKNYITVVRKTWREHLSERLGSDASAWYFENMMLDRRRALSKGDIATAAKILKDAAKLLGVEEAAGSDAVDVKFHLTWDEKGGT